MGKVSTPRVQAYRKRQRDEGLKEIRNLWVQPDHVTFLRELVEVLNQKAFRQIKCVHAAKSEKNLFTKGKVYTYAPRVASLGGNSYIGYKLYDDEEGNPWLLRGQSLGELHGHVESRFEVVGEEQ